MQVLHVIFDWKRINFYDLKAFFDTKLEYVV